MVYMWISFTSFWQQANHDRWIRGREMWQEEDWRVPKYILPCYLKLQWNCYPRMVSHMLTYIETSWPGLETTERGVGVGAQVRHREIFVLGKGQNILKFENVKSLPYAPSHPLPPKKQKNIDTCNIWSQYIFGFGSKSISHSLTPAHPSFVTLLMACQVWPELLDVILK